MGNFMDLFRLQVPDVERNYDGSPTDLHKEKVKLGKVPDEKYKVQGDSQFDNWMEDMEDGGVTPTPTPGGLQPLYPSRIKAYLYWPQRLPGEIFDGGSSGGSLIHVGGGDDEISAGSSLPSAGELIISGEEGVGSSNGNTIDGFKVTDNGFIELPNLASYYQYLDTAKGLFDFSTSSDDEGGGKEDEGNIPTPGMEVDPSYPGTPVVVGPGRSVDSSEGSGTKGSTRSGAKVNFEDEPFPFNPTYYYNLFEHKLEECSPELSPLKTIDFKSDTKLSNDNEWFGVTLNWYMPIQDIENTLWKNYMYFDANNNGATFDGRYGLDTIIYPANMEDTIKELIFSDCEAQYNRSSSVYAKMSAYCEAHGISYDWDNWDAVMELLDTEVRAAGYDDFNVSILDFTGKSCLLGITKLVGLTKAETIQWLADWWGDSSYYSDLCGTDSSLYGFLCWYLYYPLFASDSRFVSFPTQDESTAMYQFCPEFNVALPRDTKPSDIRVMLVCVPSELYIESPAELPKYELPRISYCEINWDERDEEGTDFGTKYTIPIKFYDKDNKEINPEAGDKFPGNTAIWIHGEDTPSENIRVQDVTGYRHDCIGGKCMSVTNPIIGDPEFDVIVMSTGYGSGGIGSVGIFRDWLDFQYIFSEDSKHVVAMDMNALPIRP